MRHLTLAVVFALVACGDGGTSATLYWSPWAIAWTPESRQAWVLGCPGTKITEKSDDPDEEVTVAVRAAGPEVMATITCRVHFDKRRGDVSSVSASLVHPVELFDEGSAEVAKLVEHVLTSVPAPYHEVVRAIGHRRLPAHVQVGPFNVSGQYLRGAWHLVIYVSR